MKKKITATIVATLISAAAFSANASNIAVVDMQKIFEKSAAVTAIKEQIKVKRDAYQTEITKQEEDLRQFEKKISDQRSILAPEALEEKKKEFKDKVMQVQRDVQVKRSKLDKAYADAMEKVQNEVYNIIAKIAEEKKFEIAIPTSQIVYTDKKLDITEEVTTALNKNMPKVTVDLSK